MGRRSRKQRIRAAVSTFSIALGIGFVMQYGDAMASRWGDDQPVGGPDSIDRITDYADVTPVTASVAIPQSLLIPENKRPELQVASATEIPTELETPTFAPLTEPVVDALPEVIPEPIVEVAAIEVTDDIVDAMPTEDIAETVCEETLTATPDVPALSEEALFGVEAVEGETIFAIVAVPEIAMYDRVALQWRGRSDVQLHALEFGATYGEAGHVWAASTGDRVDAAAGEGGFLTRLGTGSETDGFFADVYTFPTGLSGQDGRIALTVETEVTAMNCGQAIQAQTMQVELGARPTTQSLSMTLPDCDAIGEFLVLKNMFEDLTLASR